MCYSFFFFQTYFNDLYDICMKVILNFHGLFIIFINN